MLDADGRMMWVVWLRVVKDDALLAYEVDAPSVEAATKKAHVVHRRTQPHGAYQTVLVALKCMVFDHANEKGAADAASS